jgi:tryptophan-rich sensory protein
VEALQERKKFNVWGLLISIGIAELTGAISALISGNMTSGYSEMTQPPFSSPPIVFPIAWIILYALMGTAAYLVYIKPERESRSRGLFLYAVQLAVNFSWSIVFFHFMALSVAYAIIALLCVLVVLCAENFGKESKLAGWLMLPYIVWLFFALYLNAGVGVLN